MERLLGRLPDWMRGNRPELEESLYGKPDKLFSRCPSNLADLLRHLLKYDPAHRASARDALKHIWFAVPDPTSANLIAWLELTFKKWHETWVVTDVERTSVDQALRLLCANGDHEVADGWTQALVNSEFVLSATSFGALIEAHLKCGSQKKAKRWLDFTCLSHMDMGEEMLLRIVKASGANYEYVVKCIEDADLPVGTSVFTYMGEVAPEPYRLTEIERILADMLKRGVIPECAFVIMLFHEYAEEYATNNGHHPSRKKQSVAHYLRGTDHHKPNRNVNSPLVTRAAMAIRRILDIEPMPKLDMPAVHAMYRSLGNRSQEFLARDPWLRERLAQLKDQVIQEENDQRERQRIKEEEAQVRQEELKRRKEEAAIMAQLRAQQLSRASKSVPRNRHSGSRASSRCSTRRSASLTSLRQPTKVSPWR
mmetsp:Transcript_69544/g.127627  ORF Transcript_69544/g.127627 Transcript_69544/m.127627 type:complete len:424 (+) Transcript_69544:141-1412(+)